MSPGFWITWYNLPEQGREEYLSWLHGAYIPKVLARPGVPGAAHYASEPKAPMPREGRLPRSMGTLPGCVQVRKLISVSGWAKHACFYEFTSVEARNQKYIDHESFNPEMEAWTDRVVRKLIHAPGSPDVARRIRPPMN